MCFFSLCVVYLESGKCLTHSHPSFNKRQPTSAAAVAITIFLFFVLAAAGCCFGDCYEEMHDVPAWWVSMLCVHHNEANCSPPASSPVAPFCATTRERETTTTCVYNTDSTNTWRGPLYLSLSRAYKYIHTAHTLLLQSENEREKEKLLLLFAAVCSPFKRKYNIVYIYLFFWESAARNKVIYGVTKEKKHNSV